MTTAIRQMLTCHWTARRIQRYLDADPAAPLTPGEVTRLEQHVATCERCTEVMREHRVLHRALSLWSGQRPVDPDQVDRMRAVLDDLTEGPQ
ncbi:zf-HC2 domain-containing protein [Nocardioides sp.]|uniref:zf-HC2 domain-containing protein n=1 Tax=Nocardioides sp. TaxID=35761 RepID=UPI003563389B